MIRKFNLEFKKDDKGKLHEWKNIEEAKIKESYETIKLNLLQVLNEFRVVRFPKNLTVFNGPTEDASFEVNDFVSKIKSGVNSIVQERRSTLNAPIFSSDQIN